MNNKLKRLNNDLVITLMVLFTIIMIIAVADADFKYLNLGSTINYSNNWDKHIDKENNTLILSKDITRDMLGKALVFYTSASFVRAYIGDRQIYDFGKKSEICKSPGSLWQVIEIRNNDRYIGMRLSIHIKTVYNYMFKDDYRIDIGTSGAIMKTKIKSELIELIINVFLLLFGVLMCIIYALEKKNGINIRSNMYLGIASIAAVFWSNCALFTFQLVLPAGVLQYYLYYISFMLMPMALLKYFDNLNPRIDIKVEHFIYIMMCYTLTILQITGLKEFTETLTFYLVITTIILICILIKMFKNPIGNKHKLISIAFSIMLCCIIVNSFMWLLRPKEHVSLSIAKTGFLVYLGASLYRGFSELMIQMVQMKETDNLIKIAYNDALTGVGNRYKFDKDVKDKNIENLCLVSIDLNNLKYYNDSLGHIYGDRLIKKATEILKIVYGNNVYRTGGDEFIVIQNIKSEEERQKDRERLADLSERYTAENDKFIIEIACGDSVYRNGDITYEDILKRADKKMYEHKAEIKSKSPIKFTR